MVKDIEYRVARKDSLQGHYLIAKNKTEAKRIIAKRTGFNMSDLKANAWKKWDWKTGTATKINQKKYWK